MSLGRRKVGLHDPSAWIFNRVAQAYDARPPYPVPLVEAVADLVPAGARIGDLGAGIGHLALPLAQRGFAVTAAEPAQVMLDRLRARATAAGVALRAVHAAAEALPLPASSLDLVLVADALHFLDAELSAREIARVLAPRGALALVTCALTPTPFMSGLVAIMEEVAPRRPRAVASTITQICSMVDVPLGEEIQIHDETPLDHATLLRILQSISYIGPALNPSRFAHFSARVAALAGPRVWARTFTLRSGRRVASARCTLPRSSVRLQTGVR